MKTEDFITLILKKGYDFWGGVPCSFFKPLISYAIESPKITYIAASSEGEAVGVAMGAYLASKKSVVICQNSGLGNMVNPITSLNYPFRIPVLLIISHRGAPNIKDEPQHTFMGKITEDILDTMKIPWDVLPDNLNDLQNILDKADSYMQEKQLPYALIVKKGTFDAYSAKDIFYESSRPVLPQGEFVCSNENRMKRKEAIKIIKDFCPESTILLGTTGKIGRELFNLGYKSSHLYVVGGMGCAASIGLGISLCNLEKRVVVLDGDGSVLMKMGCLATIGKYYPKKFVHIILDNETYESTGAQATASSYVDFAEIAAACSYKAAFRCDRPDVLLDVLKKAVNIEGPVLIHLKVLSGSDKDLPRPDISPVQVKEQIRKELLVEGSRN